MPNECRAQTESGRLHTRRWLPILGLGAALWSCGGGGGGVGVNDNGAATLGLPQNICAAFAAQAPANTSANVVGGWRATYTDGFGPARVELVIQPNGVFSQQTAQGTALVTFKGTIRLFNNPNILRLDIADWEPKEICGPLGCRPNGPYTGETDCYSMPNENTLITHPAGCTDFLGACLLQYTRVL
jgi:hypothetical protein